MARFASAQHQFKNTPKIWSLGNFKGKLSLLPELSTLPGRVDGVGGRGLNFWSFADLCLGCSVSPGLILFVLFAGGSRDNASHGAMCTDRSRPRSRLAYRRVRGVTGTAGRG